MALADYINNKPTKYFENTELQRIWTEVDVRVNTWCDYYIYGILKSDLS